MAAMSADIKSTEVEDNFEQALRHAIAGKPVDPEAARRIQERAAEITERIRREHGVIDDETFQSLLDDE
jgi:hypothetical protein